MLQNSHSEARYESHIKFSSQIFYKNYYTNKNKYFFASIMAVAIQYYDQKYLFLKGSLHIWRLWQIGSIGNVDFGTNHINPAHLLKICGFFDIPKSKSFLLGSAVITAVATPEGDLAERKNNDHEWPWKRSAGLPILWSQQALVDRVPLLILTTSFFQSYILNFYVWKKSNIWESETVL